MDTYLALAQDVLRRVRRPLSAMQILRSAYEFGIAPPHLRGRTQQKTLGARLSEDILRLRDASRFYRTAPGRFLLTELADDPAIPEDLRRPIIARRRKRELPQKRSLAFKQSWFQHVAPCGGVIKTDSVLDLIRNGNYHYAPNGKHRHFDEVIVWSYMMVVKAGHVLTYRQGAYREDRDTFAHRRTLGFYAPVIDDDLSLFDQIDHGIVSSGVKALAADLDLVDHAYWPALSECSTLKSFIYPDQASSKDLLALVWFTCPDWLDPTSRRLAINDLEWMDLSKPINHHEDFDPWSQAILCEARQLALGSG
jgi:hypothetical protein